MVRIAIPVAGSLRNTGFAGAAACIDLFFPTHGFIREIFVLRIILGKSFYFCIDWRFLACIIRLSRCFAAGES